MKTITILLTMTALLFATDTLTITYGYREGTFAYTMCSRYFEEVNARAHGKLFLQLKYKPFGRAALDLTAGESDGDFLRTEYVYPNMTHIVKIPVKITHDAFYPYCKDSFLDTVTDFNSPSIRYITQLGNAVVRFWSDSLSMDLQQVADYRQAVKMIELGRGDCLILSESSQTDTVFAQYNIRMADTPLITAPSYLFINKKHEKHAGQLTKIFYDLKKEKYVEKIIAEELERRAQ